MLKQKQLEYKYKKISKAHWIWGQFVDRDMDYLDSIKSRVNEKLKGPNFDIHLTLLGPFMSMDKEKINEIKKSSTLINFRNEFRSSVQENYLVHSPHM